MPHRAEPSGPSRWVRVRPLLGVIALALFVRLAYQVSTQQSPLFQTFQLDAEWHARWAQEIAAGHWTLDRPFFRAPLYPYFLAAAYAATGQRFDGPRALQHMIGALTCGLVFLIARRLHGPRAALVAGVIAGLYGPLIYYENELLSTSLEALWLAAGVYTILRAADAPSLPRWLVAGLVFGLGAITRPTFLILWPVIVLWRWTTGRAAIRRPRRAAEAMAWTAGFFLPILPVTLHNRICGGEWVMIASQGGINFYLGNNPTADGKTPRAVSEAVPPGETFEDNVWSSSRFAAQQATGRHLSDAQVSSYWYGQGLAWWRDHPAGAIALSLKKAYYLLNGFEIPSLRPMYLDREFSTEARLLLWVYGPAFPAGLIIPLALVGLLGKSEDAARARLIRWTLAAYALAVVGFFVNSRFRAPLVPLAIVPAAIGIVTLVQAARSGTLMTMKVRLLLLGFLLVACNSNLWGVRQVDRADESSFLGEAYQRAGDLEQASAYFAEALRVQPDRFIDRYNLGVALQRLGRAREAVEQLMLAVAARPDNADVHNSLGTALESMGASDKAFAEYQEALRLDPDCAYAHLNLASLLYQRGEYAAAAQHLAKAQSLGLAVDPALASEVQRHLER